MRNKRPSLAADRATADAGPADGSGPQRFSRKEETLVPISHRAHDTGPRCGPDARPLQRRCNRAPGMPMIRAPVPVRGRQLRAREPRSQPSRPRQPCRPCARTAPLCRSPSRGGWPVHVPRRTPSRMSRDPQVQRRPQRRPSRASVQGKSIPVPSPCVRKVRTSPSSSKGVSNEDIAQAVFGLAIACALAQTAPGPRTWPLPGHQEGRRAARSGGKSVDAQPWRSGSTGRCGGGLARCAIGGVELGGHDDDQRFADRHEHRHHPAARGRPR